MAPQRTAVSQRTWLDLPFEELGLNGTKIHIEKALVYKKSRTWEIVLNATQYIPFQTIAMLQSKLRDQFFDIDHIKLRVTYRMSLESIIQNFEFIWEDLQECIKIDMPSVTWLKSCPWYWDGNVLHICARQSAKMDIATHKSVPRWIENWFQTNFFQKLKVVLLQKLEDDGAVSDEYFLKRKEELELIRQATENPITDRENGRGFAKTGTVLLGGPIKGEPLSIDTLREDSGRVIIEGCIFDTDSRELRGGKYLITIDVTDHTSSITVKMFLEPDKAKVLTGCLKKGNWFRFRGDCQYDKYQKEIVLIANDINTAQSRTRMDEAPVKRVELHLHTQMSSLDAVTSAKALIERAALWGHSAIAITDHGVVQAYPEAYAAGKRNGVKILFGVEAYLINDCRPIIQYSRNYDFDQTFVALDIETTGLDAVNNEIIEIGAVKIQGRKITDRFQSFVAPVRSIPAHITELTGITQDGEGCTANQQVLTNCLLLRDAAWLLIMPLLILAFSGKAKTIGDCAESPDC